MLDPAVIATRETIWDEMRAKEYDVIEAHYKNVNSSAQFLEIGCGSLGLLTSQDRLLDLFYNSFGVDIDRAALLQNKQVQYTLCADCTRLPFKNENFTIVVARWVVEHLENPERALQECARVLRKGGLLFVTTPNLLNYTMLIAKITPLWFHNCVTRKTGGRQDAPKYYRANTKKRLTQLAVENGFTVKYFSCDPGSFLYYAFNRYLFFGMKKISTMVSRVTSRFHLRMICLMQKRDGV